MKRLCALLAMATLAGCGADGEPIRPSMNATVGMGSHGASGSAGLSVARGPVAVGWGLGP